jgi:hypothetical protein
MEPITPLNYKKPSMVRWFDPILLAKLLLRVILSQWFGQFADRRLIEAALDAVPDKTEFDKRADFTELPKDEKGAVWVDFVADLGEGFESTYAIASLLAPAELTVDSFATKRGQILIMGGDEVYPTATRENYNCMTYAYRWASSGKDPTIPIFAIPGRRALVRRDVGQGSRRRQ